MASARQLAVSNAKMQLKAAKLELKKLHKLNPKKNKQLYDTNREEYYKYMGLLTVMEDKITEAKELVDRLEGMTEQEYFELNQSDDNIDKYNIGEFFYDDI